MINRTQVSQVAEFVVRPALKFLGEYNDIALWSPIAEALVVRTGVQESAKFQYIDQLTPGPGPAYGPFQMEKPTLENHINWLSQPDRKDLMAKIEMLRGEWIMDTASELHGNWFLAAALCRVHYLRVNEPLPTSEDLHEIGAYWKRHYNTMAGKGTVDEFVRNNS